MNVTNFSNHINQTILQRGIEYYEAGNVVDVKEESANLYIFHIEGSDDYEVVVQIDDDGEILSSYCDCPKLVG